MPKSRRRSNFAVRSLRDAGLGFAVYSAIAVVALEDRAQAGFAVPSPTQSATLGGTSLWTDPSLLTLTVLGLLFAALTAFTLSVWRHFGQNFALARVRTEKLPKWSLSVDRAYKKR